MHFKIIDNPTYSNIYTVGIDLEPDAMAVKLFFSGVKLDQYPEMIAGVLQDKGHYGDVFGVLFHDDLDAEDFAEGEGFEPHQVKFYNRYFGEQITDARFFKLLLMSFATKLMDRYREELEAKGIMLEFRKQLVLLASQVARWL